MGGYFTGTGTGKLVPANRPRENPSMRVIFNTEGYLRGNLRGRSTHAVQSIISLLLYILVPVPVNYPRDCTHGDGGGDECPRTREIPAHGTGG